MTFQEVVRGSEGKIRFQGLLIGELEDWSFPEGTPEVAVNGYVFNKVWYEQGRWFTLELASDDGYWEVVARPKGYPQLDKWLSSRLIFETKGPPEFIKGV